MKKIALLSITILFMSMTGLSAQDAEAMQNPELESSFGFSIGTVTLDETTYNSIRFMPEIEMGKLGIGLDLDFRFTLAQGESGDTEFQVYQKDWYLPDGATAQEYINLYLSKFNYIRWGQEKDPLYLKFGALTGSSLGNGFIMGGYTNTQFLPEKRIFGGQFNLDGSLLNFPYVGVEGLVSNLSQFDLFGGRVYTRPAAGTDIPIVKNIIVGGSYIMDTNAYLYSKDENGDDIYDFSENYTNTIATSVNADAVTVTGVDTLIPIISSNIASLALMADVVFQGLEDSNMGIMTGLGGKVLFFNYTGQVRFMKDNFLPTYFDQGYDLQRAQKYQIYSSDSTIIEASNAYLVSAGTSLLSNSLIFNMSVEGPFEKPKASVEENPLAYPHVKGILVLKEGVLDFADFQFWYDKVGVNSWKSLVSPEYAIIGGLVNFRMDPAVITAQVDIKYDPDSSDNWTVTSQLSTGIQF